MNPLLQNTSQLKSIFNAVKCASNPQAYLNQIMSNNPQYKQVMDYVNQNGGNPQQAFMKMCEEKGVNPNDILNQLR